MKISPYIISALNRFFRINLSLKVYNKKSIFIVLVKEKKLKNLKNY